MKKWHETKLKKLLELAGVSLSKFAGDLGRYANISISKSTAFHLVNEGKLPKRIPYFKEKLEAFITENYKKELEELNFKKEEILEKYKENTMEQCVILSQEAMKHFNLKLDPFMPVLTSENQILMLQAHYYALENMRITAEMGLMTAITGQVGSGKTTVLAKFKRLINKQDKFIIVQPKTREIGRITTREILEAILYKLSDERPKRNLESLSTQVERLLQESYDRGKRCILVIEEAQDLHTHTLKRLKRLWEIGEDELTPLLAIILIGQNELAYRLYGSQNMNLREVASRITHVELGAINHELQSYIAHKFKVVGAKHESIITKEAVEELANRFISKDQNGKISYIAYPNKINNTMKLLLNTACTYGEEIINKEVIEYAGV